MAELIMTMILAAYQPVDKVDRVVEKPMCLPPQAYCSDPNYNICCNTGSFCSFGSYCP